MYTWLPVYTWVSNKDKSEEQFKLGAHMACLYSLFFDIGHVVFVGFMLSLCACRNWLSTLCIIIPFPVLMSLIHFWFSSFFKWPLKWADISEVGTIVPNSTVPNCISEVRVKLSLAWHWWVSSFDLRVVNQSCTLAFFYLLWFGLHLIFPPLSSIFALGLAMMGLAFFSSYL